MDDIAIRVEKLSKSYDIANVKRHHDTLRDQVAHTVRSLFRHDTNTHSASSTIWALKGVSFEVKRGEVVGLIGNNGAGKSTLLKVLSRITAPTEGRVEIYGRIASLLEVGTGFHPELTGRENIYLNGGILGMKKTEIARKFDEIVAFAEVEQFIDTPVKRYSSGMYVRLAFAIAAHLEAEILLIDEVLAVGDTAFQKKCLGKMGEVAHSGRTVIFVSHTMTAVANLCSQAILIRQGQIQASGETRSVIHTYLRSLRTQIATPLDDRTDRGGSGQLRFSRLRILDQQQRDITTVLAEEPLQLTIEFSTSAPTTLHNVLVSATFFDVLGQLLFTVGTNVLWDNVKSHPSKGRFICHIPQLLLTEGQYRIDLWSSVNGEPADYIQEAAILEVVSVNMLGRRKHGFFLMPHSWHWEDLS
jgi:lipopolysaccharide transport system ATP-binding protein